MSASAIATLRAPRFLDCGIKNPWLPRYGVLVSKVGILTVCEAPVATDFYVTIIVSFCQAVL